jgi:hypothetical protein
MGARALQIDALLSGFLDGNGDPYSGGSLTVYDEGTVNLATIYSQADKGAAAANPITLDTRGSFGSSIFVDGKVKFLLKDSGGSTIDTWDELTYESVQLSTVAKERVYTVVDSNNWSTVTQIKSAAADPTRGDVTTQSVQNFAAIPLGDLPIGAVITDVTSYGIIDAATANEYLTIELDGRLLTTSGAGDTIVTLTAIGDVDGTGVFAVTSSGINYTLLNTQKYEIIADLFSATGNTYMYGVKVGYTVTSVTGIT